MTPEESIWKPCTLCHATGTVKLLPTKSDTIICPVCLGNKRHLKDLYKINGPIKVGQTP